MKGGTVAVGYLHPGHVSFCFQQSLQRLYLADAFGAQRMVPNGMELPTFCSSGGLVDSRNKVCKAFLDDTQCEWLFFVDTDMGFDPDIVERLIEAADPVKRQIVGALCFALRRQSTDSRFAVKYQIVPTVYGFEERDDEAGFAIIADYPRDQVVRVAATGAAAMLIHRSALHKIRQGAGDVWFDQVTHPKGKDGPTRFSEDLSFCVRANYFDIDVFVHTGVQTCHDKGGIFLDEEAFDRQQALVKEAQNV